MTGTTRSSEGLDARRRKLLYHAWHRGTREMDLILGRFADAELGTLSEPEVAELERLSDLSDGELYAWISGAKPVPPNYDTAMYRRLLGFNNGPIKA